MIAKFDTTTGNSSGDGKSNNMIIGVLAILVIGYIGYRYMVNRREKEKQTTNE
jgi:hypothetical protein